MIESIGVSATKPNSGDDYKMSLIVRGIGPVDLSLLGSETTTMHVQGLKADESTGSFKQPPNWSVDRLDIVVIAPSPDGLHCSVLAAVPLNPGTAVVTVTDTENPNVQPITISVTIAADPITHMRVNIDPPQPKTPA